MSSSQCVCAWYAADLLTPFQYLTSSYSEVTYFAAKGFLRSPDRHMAAPAAYHVERGLLFLPLLIRIDRYSYHSFRIFIFLGGWPLPDATSCGTSLDEVYPVPGWASGGSAFVPMLTDFQRFEPLTMSLLLTPARSGDLHSSLSFPDILTQQRCMPPAATGDGGSTTGGMKSGQAIEACYYYHSCRILVARLVLVW